jgi:hypothetical protein
MHYRLSHPSSMGHSEGKLSVLAQKKGELNGHELVNERCVDARNIRFSFNRDSTVIFLKYAIVSSMSTFSFSITGLESAVLLCL